MVANDYLCRFLLLLLGLRMTIYKILLATSHTLRPAHEPGRAQEPLSLC